MKSELLQVNPASVAVHSIVKNSGYNVTHVSGTPVSSLNRSEQYGRSMVKYHVVTVADSSLSDQHCDDENPFRRNPRGPRGLSVPTVTTVGTHLSAGTLNNRSATSMTVSFAMKKQEKKVLCL